MEGTKGLTFASEALEIVKSFHHEGHEDHEDFGKREEIGTPSGLYVALQGNFLPSCPS
jgi:hypothetical protein